MATSPSNYDDICENMLVQLYERVRYLEQGPFLDFTSSQKMMLQLSWKAFVGGDPSQRGFDMFLKMFENSPHTQGVFDFAKGSSSAQMQNSSRLIFHVTRVVKYLSKVVDHLDDPEEIVPLLKQLGGRHGVQGYKVPASYFPHLGKAMRQLMKEAIGNWTDQHDLLWDKLYTWTTDRMTEGQKTYGGGIPQ